MQIYRLRAPNGQYASSGRQGYTSPKGSVWAGRGAMLGHIAVYGDPLAKFKEYVVIVIDEEAKTFTEIEFDIWYAEYLQEKARKGK